MFRKTEEIDRSSQNTGDGSIAYQARGDINIVQGIDYSIVKETIMDLFKANAYELTRTAGAIAEARAREVIDKYLTKINEVSPDKIENLSQPDMLYAMISAQKAYARSGDEDLSDILVDILVDRTQREERNLIQISLTESLNVVPKLTMMQFDLLSSIFLIRHVRFLSINNMSSLIGLYESLISNYIDHFPKNDSTYTHLQYAGCGKIDVSEADFISIIFHNYQNVLKGIFSRNEIRDVLSLSDVNAIQDLLDKKIVYEVFGSQDNSVKNLVFLSNHPNLISLILLSQGYTSVNVEGIKSLIERPIEQEVLREIIRNTSSKLEQINLSWSQSPAKSFTLTSVGITIANANIKRKGNAGHNLEIWINED